MTSSADTPSWYSRHDFGNGSKTGRRRGRAVAKILIVEDNEENQDVLSRRLRRRGYDVVIAADGELGVAMARSEAPDLILMDMNMPRLDGWGATRLLKD